VQLLLLTAAISLTPGQAEDATKVTIRDATVRLYVADGYGNVGSGSGVIVGKDGNHAYVLSAHHVTAGASGFTIQTFSARDRQQPSLEFSEGISVVAEDAASDLSLLRIATHRQVPVLKVLSPAQARKLGAGTAVSHCGCPGGAPPEVRRGSLQGVRADFGVPTYWDVNMVVEQGCSGGPLVATGGVIGICSHGHPNQVYFSHADRIHALLDQAGLTHLYAGRATASGEEPAAPPARLPVHPRLPARPQFIPEEPVLPAPVIIIIVPVVPAEPVWPFDPWGVQGPFAPVPSGPWSPWMPAQPAWPYQP
jgi:hypothetical protein